MPRFVVRFFALSVLCAAGAFGQVGSFGQIAYGGSWQTTFTLINLNPTNVATVTLSFFGDDGSPLNVPVQGITSAYTFAIPAGGSKNIVLTSSDQNTTQGWAKMNATGGTVRGQASFRVQLPKGGISEAVVPLTIPPGLILCIVPFPAANPIISVPFDNTGGQYLTSLAFANTTNSPQSYVIEFYDQSGALLFSDNLALSPMQHQAFVTTDRFPTLQGERGVLRIHADPANLTVLGLLSNLTGTGAITTIIPVTQ